MSGQISEPSNECWKRRNMDVVWGIEIRLVQIDTSLGLLEEERANLQAISSSLRSCDHEPSEEEEEEEEDPDSSESEADRQLGLWGQALAPPTDSSKRARR